MDDSFYRGLMESKVEQEEESNGVDAFLSGDKIKVASLGDLSGFIRISQDTLVNKAKKDLWTIKETSDGGLMIERLFDAKTKEPLKI